MVTPRKSRFILSFSFSKTLTLPGGLMQAAGHLKCSLQDCNLLLLCQDDLRFLLKICLHSFLLLRHFLQNASQRLLHVCVGPASHL